MHILKIGNQNNLVGRELNAGQLFRKQLSNRYTTDALTLKQPKTLIIKKPKMDNGKDAKNFDTK